MIGLIPITLDWILSKLLTQFKQMSSNISGYAEVYWLKLVNTPT